MARCQVSIFNTFAPVVKSITVRLLLPLVFIFNMHIHLSISSHYSSHRVYWNHACIILYIKVHACILQYTLMTSS